jgi:two-component system cell cycle response regulator DivK
MKPTVLVIEDNAITGEFVRLALESRGYSVLLAVNGKDGISMAIQHSPHLILQDLLLPDIDGLDLVERLRALPEVNRIPVLAFSAFRSKLDAAKLCPAFTGYVPKPIEPLDLIQTVGRYLADQVQHP